jgi:hypothetical protein
MLTYKIRDPSHKIRITSYKAKQNKSQSLIHNKFNVKG